MKEFHTTNQEEMGNKVIYLRNCTLSKSYYEKNYLIEISDIQGNVTRYNHDKVLHLHRQRITNLPCWNKYGSYTKSGGTIPNYMLDGTL